MKNKLKAVLCTTFALLISVPATTFAWLKFSQAGKEDFPVFPAWSEMYGQDLVNYLEKTFPFRGNWIEYYKSIDGEFLKKFNNFLEKISGGKYLIPCSQNNAIFGKKEWLFYEGDNSIGFYRGTNILNESEMANYYENMKKLIDICEKKKIKLCFMSCPNKEIVYSEFMPSFSIVNEYRHTQRLKDYLDNRNIKLIYPLNELLSNKNNRCCYYQQDTHWNEYGAFVGYNVFKEAMNLSKSTCDFTETIKTGGDLSDMCGIKSTYKDYLSEYKKDIVYKYLEKNDDLRFEHTKNDNAEYKNKVYLMGDSFRTALKGYLFKDFQECYVSHISSIDCEAADNFLNSLKENDYIILECVERYNGNLIYACSNLASKLQ